MNLVYGAHGYIESDPINDQDLSTPVNRQVGYNSPFVRPLPLGGECAQYSTVQYKDRVNQYEAI